MKQIALLCILAIGVFSCNKSTNTEPASTANFTITGIHDVDLNNSSNASISYTIQVVPTGSAKDTVTLSVDNLPKGVYIHFSNNNSITAFNAKVSFSTDYTGPGGNFPITIIGTGHSGVRSYTMDLNIPTYKGWNIGGITYNQTSIYTIQGTASQYASIRVNGGGAGQLTINFAKGRALPTKTKTYTISNNSDSAADNIQIGFYDYPMLFSATGAGKPTGTFTFDTLGKFVFHCTGVEMSDGLNKKSLDVSIHQE